MNSLICLSLLFTVAAAQFKPQPIQWGYSVSDEAVKPASWHDGVSYVSSAPQTGYWPSYYAPSVHSAEIAPKNWYLHKNQHHHSVPVARSDSSEWKVQPVSWSDASYVPQSWSAGYYSAGIPSPAKVEKQIVAKKVVAPIVKVDQAQSSFFDQAQPVADPNPKLVTYSTEITHDVPAKREEVPSVVPTRNVLVAPQVAPKVVSAPAQYAAWSAGEIKPVADPKPATWTSEIKPATWTSEVKPASWSSEVKPASWMWAAEPKPATWAAWAPESKPASWSSWSEAKPWSSYVSPVQPAFYGSWAQPAVATNAHHAISAPWSSTWSTAHPMTWTEGIQKRSERKPF